jgi:hypothetical protein
MAVKKGYAVPVPATGHPTKTFCITIPDVEEYRQAFWGQLLDLTYYWSWEPAGGTEQRDAADVWTDLFLTNVAAANAGIGCTDLPVELRQSPDDPCILEFSTDGGSIWQEAFNFRLCDTGPRISSEINFNFIDASQTTLTNNFTTYNGDIINVAPDWQYGDANDSLRQRALCYALGLWVDLVVDTIIEIKLRELEEQKDILDNVSDIFDNVSNGILGAIAIGFAPAWAPWAALGFAIGAVAAELASELLMVDLSIYQDETLRDEIVCCMYDAMEGATPTYAAWQTSLSSCSLTGDHETLRAEIAKFLNDEEMFVQLFVVGIEGLAVQQAGGILPCDCFEWCKDLDLSAFSACFDAVSATYAAGQLTFTGVGCTDTLPGDKIVGACVPVDAGGEFHVTRVEVNIVSQGASNCGSPGFTVRALNTAQNQEQSTGLGLAGETGLVTWDLDEPDFAYAAIALRLPVGETLVIDGIKVFGISLPPSGLNC